MVGNNRLTLEFPSENFSNRGGEVARLLSIVKMESDEEFWRQIHSLTDYFVWNPFTKAGREPNGINDYHWFTGDFLDELVKRCINTKDQELINARIYFIIDLFTQCVRYINDDGECAEFKRFEPLFKLSKTVSMTRALQTVLNNEYQLVYVENMSKLTNWVSQNEDLYIVLESLHLIWKMFPKMFIDDVVDVNLNQMKIVMQRRDTIMW